MNTILSVLFLASSVTCFAQKTDFLVKHTGDTVFGKIELKHKTFFITETTGAVTELNAGFVNKVFSSGIKHNTVVPCKLQTYTDDLTEIMKYHYESRIIDTVMVLDEVYQTPKMNLYWGTDDFKRQYYFYKTAADSLPIQLFINYALGSGIDGQKVDIPTLSNYSSMHLVVQKSFVNQLRFIMGDCKKISDAEWDLLDYRIYSFKALIKRYNKCK